MKIQIGAHEMKVIIKERPNSGSSWVFGYFDQASNTICIDECTPPSRQFEILWHEILHGLFWQLGKNNHNEKLIGGLAEQLAAVLENNPALRSIKDYKREVAK